MANCRHSQMAAFRQLNFHLVLYVGNIESAFEFLQEVIVVEKEGMA